MKMVDIRVTQVLGCRRAYQHRIQHHKQLLPHFYNVKGTLIHHCIEKVLGNKNLPDIEQLMRSMYINENSYLENRLLAELTQQLESVQKWVSTTTINLNNIVAVEQELRMPIKDGYDLVGHVDLVTDTHIIDFKSGEPKNLVTYSTQLGAYYDLCQYAGYNDKWKQTPTKTNVFLGNLLEYSYDENHIQSSMPHYYDKLMDLIEEDQKIRANSKYQAPCKISLLCAFCDYRSCRGV